MADRDILTVLFTDIAASTVMRTTRGDDRADEILAVHDELVRELGATHAGRVVKHTGDGAMVSFRSARNAVEFAIALQRRLDELSSSGVEVPGVRIGLNAGEVTVTDDDDLLGQAVNAAARIASTADAGEIVVSEVLRSLVGQQPGLVFEDFGSHELSGFSEPWPLLTVVWRRATRVRQVRLLGEVQVLSDGQRIEGDATPRSLLVLGALAMAGGRTLDRADLAFRLWPESTDQQARTNLRKVLHEIQAWLSDDQWLDVDQRRVRLRTDAVDVDVLTFLEAVESGDVRKVAASYGGPLLPGLWDDWVLDERARLQDAAVTALHRALTETHDPLERVDTAKRLLQLDRADEAAHRALIRAHAEAGNRAAALRAFHTCTTVLERELGVAPSAETVAVYEAARAAGSASSGPTVRRPGVLLVGRDEELCWVEDAWSAGVSGQGPLAALISGESGIGKSRLVEELASTRERGGAVVLRSRAYESDAGRTLAPVVDWLRHDRVTAELPRLAAHQRAALGRLLPELPVADEAAPWSPNDVRAATFDAAANALALAGAPQLLVLDDLQWCGPDAVDFVAHLLRRGPASGLLLAMTRRDHERPADPDLDRKLADLRAEGSLRDRRLGRLKPVDTSAIARAATAHEWSDHELAQLHVETDGHPLFVIEAARAGPGGDHLTSTVKGMIERRLAHLSDEQRRLLDLAAVFGRRFGPDELAIAAGLDEDEVVDALDDLWRNGLVIQDGADFDFGHDNFREVVLSGVSPARRGRLHRRVAEALVAVSGGVTEVVAERLAEHYERAGQIDDAIGAYRLAAGRASKIGAHTQAIQHLQDALRLLMGTAEGSARDQVELAILTDLGTAYAVAAGYGSPEAQATWERSTSLSRRLGTSLSGPVLRGIALAAIADCRFERAIEMGDALCELDDAVACVEGHYVLGVTRFWLGEFRAAERHLEQALSDYDPAAAPEHLALYGQDPRAVCLCRLAYLRVAQGRGHEADQHLVEAEALAADLDHGLTRWYVWTYRQIVDRALGRLIVGEWPSVAAQGFFAATDQTGRLWEEALEGRPGAEEALEEIAAAWRRPGHQLQLTTWLTLLAELRLRAGDAPNALVHIDEADAFIDRVGQRYVAPELCRLRAWAMRLQGDAGCAESARRGVMIAEGMGAAGYALKARTELLRCTSDPQVAADLRAHVDELRATHHGVDLEDADRALADQVTSVTVEPS